jgi:hypothetical protein
LLLFVFSRQGTFPIIAAYILVFDIFYSDGNITTLGTPPIMCINILRFIVYIVYISIGNLHIL